MEFAHARDDKLARLLVGKTTEGWIFFCQTLEALAHLLTVSLGLRLDGHGNNRFRESGRLEQNFKLLIAKGVTSSDVLEANQRGNVSRIRCLHINTFIRL